MLYLLSRSRFRRRAVASIVAILALAEGMLFANARIAMNDVYVTFFVLAALTVFAGLWLGRWRRALQVIVGPIIVGLLLGLALASKWVAAYAIGGIVLLILLRSALGRLIALVAMVGLTAVLGGVAIRTSAEAQSRNWLFPIIMIGLTLHGSPPRWSAGRCAGRSTSCASPCCCRRPWA
ncbi:MAG: phospholipid carrier-dependent glycosyltransferase [Chloroflexota bacterium]